MKKYKFLFLLLVLQSAVYAQTNKLNGTYVLEMEQYLTIKEDSFKLYLYPTYSMFYGLSKGDTILAEGKVQYDSENFIKLTSKDYEREAENNMTILESVDSDLNDSIRFNFDFPYEGKTKIRIYIEVKGNRRFEILEFENSKTFVIPFRKENILYLSFTILNQTPIDSSAIVRNYLRTNQFRSGNIIKTNSSNTFDIFIPDLTNSYFNRCLINGEYLKIDINENELMWHNELYFKLRTCGE